MYSPNSQLKWITLLLLTLGLSQPVARATASPVLPQAVTCNTVLNDGDFESAMSPWDERYPALQAPAREPAPIALCDSGSCDVAPAQSPAGPYSGDWWAWFGGGITDTVPIQSVTQSVSQTVTLPVGQSASLSFYLWISRADPGTDASDVLRISLGSVPVFTATALNHPQYSAYRQVRLNLSALANGLPAPLVVSATTRAAQNTPPPIINFNVDAMQLCSPGVWPVYLPVVGK